MYNVKKKIIIKNRVRFGLFMVVCMIMFNLIMFATINPSSTNADISHKTEIVYVGAGDTLWEIAEEYCQDGTDIREVIYKIKKLNNLKTADLTMGQEIVVPLN